MEGKHCNGPLCHGAIRPLEEFGKDAHRHDGLAHQCRACKAEYRRRNREARLEANPEKVREQEREHTRRYRNPERDREYARRSREANPEKYRERDRRYRAANPDKVHEQEREYNRRRREANPEKNREQVRQWRELHPNDGHNASQVTCSACGRTFSHEDSYELCHRTDAEQYGQLYHKAQACYDPASRGLVARRTKAGIVWGFLADRGRRRAV